VRLLESQHHWLLGYAATRGMTPGAALRALMGRERYRELARDLSAELEGDGVLLDEDAFRRMVVARLEREGWLEAGGDGPPDPAED
jgi:hypothetical protein